MILRVVIVLFVIGRSININAYSYKNIQTILKVLLFVMLLVFSFESISGGSSDILREYMGPGAGVKYTYELKPQGQNMTIEGVSEDATGIHLVETIILPSNVKSKVREIVNKTKLYVQDGKLLQKGLRGTVELIHAPLVKNNRTWNMNASTYTNGKQSAVISNCVIDDVFMDSVFDEERKSVTVSCSLMTPNVKTVTKYTYSKGIGLVRKNMESFDKAGNSYGVVKQILVKVE